MAGPKLGGKALCLKVTCGETRIKKTSCRSDALFPLEAAGAKEK